MNVVFLRSNPVDPDSRVEKQANSLVKAGFNVEIVAWDRSSKYHIKEAYISLGSGVVRVFRFGIPATFGGGVRKNLISLIMFQIKLFKWLYINKSSYDIIHACDFDTAYIAMQAAKKLNKKIIYDIFDYYVDSFNVPFFLKNFIEKRDHKIINSADATIICTEKRKEQIKGTSPKLLCVIHNTPNELDNTVNILDLNKSKIKIVYVGILVNGRLLKEITEFIKDNQKYEFHIGGFGQLEGYFKEMSRQYSNIIFYGKLPYKKTLELENSCDIMTAIYDPSNPNHYYAAPNKFYEALMLGKPLIVAKNTGIDEIVEAENIGEVITYSNLGFINGLKKLSNRYCEWDEISKRTRKLYEKKYNWNEMERRLINIYKNL
ncbi:MAG: glycosyltransferase family 4 protein [Clostridia bacterium]|nr:glycosyltransferase family 4 protein [Clostridia bacterium]